MNPSTRKGATMATTAPTPRKRPTARKTTITMDQLYDGQVAQGEAIQQLADSVKDGFNSLNSKLDLQIQKDEQTEKVVADHEVRIRTVEKQSWKTLGFGSAVGAIVSALGLFIGNIFHLTK